MSFSTTWDIDKYRSEFESKEHWELRKRFMETHKCKFPEDRVVCLARVFFNVEFLGCRYPEKTMQLIAELSKGVADEHREKQKGKLKRTFVQASDAAGAKIKGTPSSQVEPPHKMLKTQPKPSMSGNPCFVQATAFKHPVAAGDFPGFILFENCNSRGQIDSSPISILNNSAQKSNTWSITYYFPPEKNIPQKEQRYCELKLNNKVLSSGTGITVKEAKVNAATEGLSKLRKTCYTIQGKCAYFSEGASVGKEGTVLKEAEKPLCQDNIGSKIMQKMGWTGSGLGKKKQGIQEPVKATSQIVQRAGLGSINPVQFKNKFTQIFRDFIANGSDDDLVFTPDFSSDERKILHRLAQNMQLKTRSYGKEKDRHLVVYKVSSVSAILDMLIACGGENEKYVLIPPSDPYEPLVSNTNEPALGQNIPMNNKEESKVPLINSFSTREDNSGSVNSRTTQHLPGEYNTNSTVGSKTCSENNFKTSLNKIKVSEESPGNKDMALLNNILQRHIEDVRQWRVIFDKLAEKHKKQLMFKRREKKQLMKCIRMLACLTDNSKDVKEFKVNTKDTKGSKKKSHTERNEETELKFKCKAFGLETVINNTALKEKLLSCIKKQLDSIDIRYKENARKVSKCVGNEIVEIGKNELLKCKYQSIEYPILFGGNPLGPLESNCFQMNLNLYSGQLGKRSERNTVLLEKRQGTKKNEIKFVRENQLYDEDKGSGVEYSDNSDKEHNDTEDEAIYNSKNADEESQTNPQLLNKITQSQENLQLASKNAVIESQERSQLTSKYSISNLVPFSEILKSRTTSHSKNYLNKKEKSERNWCPLDGFIDNSAAKVSEPHLNEVYDLFKRLVPLTPTLSDCKLNMLKNDLINILLKVESKENTDLSSVSDHSLVHK